VFIGAFYVLKNSPLVQNSPVLSRFASISWDEAKGQARNFIWPMAIKGAIEHPVLGWGQEGFSYVFQKYYVPVMITQEPWFDRAHNAFLDWLVAGGFPGFLAYLSLYIISIIFIWRSTVFSNKEKAVLLGLIAAYAFQNIFIFDNIMSYIFFASFLAFVSARHIEAKVENSNKSDSEINIATLTVCAIAFVAVMLLLNAKGFLQNTTLINAMTPQKLGVEQNFTLLKQAIGDGAMGTYEAREQLIRITQQVVSAPNVSNETKLAFANETVSQMDKQLTETPQDARAFLEFGDFLVNIGAFDQAIPQLEKAKALSPEKQQTAFTLVRAYIGKGLSAKDPKQMDEALSIMKEAYELAPNVDASRLPYISALLVAGKAADAVNIIDEVNDPSPLMNVTLIKSMTAAGFKDDAIKLLKRQISLDSQNADAYVLLSNVYVDAKDSKDAISILEDMSAAIPSQKDEADKDIATIKAGLK
jgi:tetratricopeptide (TPR) repeat protein